MICLVKGIFHGQIPNALQHRAKRKCSGRYRSSNPLFMRISHVFRLPGGSSSCWPALGPSLPSRPAPPALPGLQHPAATPPFSAGLGKLSGRPSLPLSFFPCSPTTTESRRGRRAGSGVCGVSLRLAPPAPLQKRVFKRPRLSPIFICYVAPLPSPFSLPPSQS